MNNVSMHKVSKIFNDTTRALDNVSLHIAEGEIFGFLGPNGSGKTTTIKILNGVLFPSKGSCEVFGFDPAVYPEKVHEISGVLTEHAQMYDNLTGRQNLDFYANLFGLAKNQTKKRTEELLQKLGLFEAGDRKLSAYSTGMRQRLSLARALIHKPRALFLDEPTSGLDPESAKSVNELLRELAHNQGTTIFLCTHQLRYAQEVCTRYGLVDKGTLIAQGDLDSLRAQLAKKYTLSIQVSKMDPRIAAEQKADNLYEIAIESEHEISALVRRIVDKGGDIYAVSTTVPSLEDIYFSLIEKRKKKEGAGAA